MPLMSRMRSGKARKPRRSPLLACLALAAASLAAPAAAEAKTADLSVSQTPSANPVRTGQEFSFEITVANAGPDSVNAAKLVDVTPKRADFLGMTASQGSCAQHQRRVECKLGPIAAGAGVSLSLRVRVTGQKSLVNEVRVNSKATDPKPNNNTSKQRVDISNQAPVFCGGQIATIIGTDGPDNLIGTDHKDVIAALSGNDSVIALEGNDLVCASGGNDVVKGNAGNDDIRGGGGRDSLSAGDGNDVVFGKSDNDVLHGGPGSDVLRGGGGHNKCFGDGGHTIKRSCS